MHFSEIKRSPGSGALRFPGIILSAEGCYFLGNEKVTKEFFPQGRASRAFAAYFGEPQLNKNRCFEFAEPRALQAPLASPHYHANGRKRSLPSRCEGFLPNLIRETGNGLRLIIRTYHTRLTGAWGTSPPQSPSQSPIIMQTAKSARRPLVAEVASRIFADVRGMGGDSKTAQAARVSRGRGGQVPHSGGFLPEFDQRNGEWVETQKPHKLNAFNGGWRGTSPPRPRSCQKNES